MNAALRRTLTAITVVDLAFVHATEAASVGWLAPMYAVALASSWLGRLERSAVYRWTWNVAVIAIFGVLLRHTATAGPRYLLEDGLRLAAVCQVHLLCNLGARQKPDLLFFNSFLIAVVTAFLTQDFLYSVVFLAYAPLLVVALGLHAAQRAGPQAEGAVVRDTLRRAAFALAATFVVFMAWPRDFHRRGLVVESLSSGRSAALDIGFSEEVRIERAGTAGSSDRVVARVRLVRGSPLEVPAYFRGSTQLRFDGERWESGLSSRLGDPRWTPANGRRLRRDLPSDGPLVEVELEDTSAARLFVPLTAKSLELMEDDSPAAVSLPDGTLRFLADGPAAAARALRYRMGLAESGPRAGGPVPNPAPDALAPALELESCPAMPAVERTALDVRRALPAVATQHEVVEAMRERLASRSDYLPPGSPDAARDVESFVRGEAGGHCEHFATALALMLRRVGVPCRLVTGYLSDEWDTTGRTLTIRRRHAHAWVEVKDPAGGWMTVDPTPATARAGAASASLLSEARAWLGRAWSRVIFFDADQRAALAAWFAALPGRAGEFVRENVVACWLAAAAAAMACVVVRNRRLLGVPPPVREYRACLKRLRLAPRLGETPRELLSRAPAAGVAGPELERLADVTRRHEEARFAGAAASPLLSDQRP